MGKSKKSPIYVAIGYMECQNEPSTPFLVGNTKKDWVEAYHRCFSMNEDDDDLSLTKVEKVDKRRGWSDFEVTNDDSPRTCLLVTKVQ